MQPVQPAVQPPAALAGAGPALVAVVRAAVESATPASERAARRTGCRLFVAPDLCSFEATPDEAELFGRDVTQTDADGTRRVYRRLSPPYYVWLREALAAARARVSPAVYATLCARARPIKAASVAFDAQRLAQLIALGARGRYEPPRPYGDGMVEFDPGRAPVPISKEVREWCDRVSGRGRRRSGVKAKKLAGG